MQDNLEMDLMQQSLVECAAQEERNSDACNMSNSSLTGFAHVMQLVDVWRACGTKVN